MLQAQLEIGVAHKKTCTIILTLANIRGKNLMLT